MLDKMENNSTGSVASKVLKHIIASKELKKKINKREFDENIFKIII